MREFIWPNAKKSCKIFMQTNGKLNFFVGGIIFWVNFFFSFEELWCERKENVFFIIGLLNLCLKKFGELYKGKRCIRARSLSSGSIFSLYKYFKCFNKLLCSKKLQKALHNILQASKNHSQSNFSTKVPPKFEFRNCCQVPTNLPQ